VGFFKYEFRRENTKKPTQWILECGNIPRFLATNFMMHYTCGQLINIDEMCIFSIGRHRCKCYNPRKPNKWHLKAYCLNAIEYGYLFNFFMYRGSDERRPPGTTAAL
jgi:hypothetical protein